MLDLKRFSADPLAEFDGFDDLPQTQESVAFYPTEAPGQDPAELFRYDDYIWDDFVPPKGQITLPLTQGYFTFVGEEDMDRLEGRKVSVSISYCPCTGKPKVSTRLSVNNVKLPLHRYLMDARKGQIVDHINNWHLDNRRLKNLWCTSSSANNANRFFGRTKHKGLKRGVKKLNGRFLGRICFNNVEYWSKSMDTEDEAHAWYIAKFKEFHKVDENLTKPERSYPIFPPRKPGARSVWMPSACILPGTTVDDLSATF